MGEPKAPRLSQISTLWSQVRRAHLGPAEATTVTRHQLLERYGRAVHRYLLGALADADAADDLMQEFAFRFLRGDFHRADQHRGRFRDFVRTALVRLIARDRRKQRRQPGPLPDDGAAPPVPQPEGDGSEAAFLRAWREELLNRAWAALARFQEETGRPVYLVLRFAVEHPQLRSPELAVELTRQLGKPVTAVGVRQALHRARAKFTALLVEEVAQTLDDPSADRLTEELLHLDLWRYCRSALEHSGRG
jgi:RNA polymerase sigma-70 factor (ECF subfamily)